MLQAKLSTNLPVETNSKRGPTRNVRALRSSMERRSPPRFAPMLPPTSPADQSAARHRARASPSCSSARIRRARFMCATRPSRPSKSAWSPSSTSCRPRRRRGRASGARRQAQRRPGVHGILVQLPLPKHIDSKRCWNSIDPAKDVDGFHPINVGRLSIGERALAPCTPVGSVILAKSVRHDLVRPRRGRRRPLQHRRQADGAAAAARELHRDDRAFAHQDCRTSCARADLVVAAVGKPELVKGDWIKPGAIVIDVGINRIRQAGRQDASSSATWPTPRRRKVAGAITPVPGGVGPMTIACLLRNAALAAAMQAGVKSAFA